ncbi:CapA family protein [Candidatus Peregrinibacteria bacterium]|nr:CapA family protein [Candidatus Peregrinibacteria bacterium]
MSKWTVLLGAVVATVILYKVNIQEITLVDVMKYVVVNNIKKPVIKDQSLSIMAFGDVMLGRYVRVIMDQNGLYYPFEKIKDPANLFTEGANVVFGNLEGPVDGEGTKGGTSMVFSFGEDIGPILKKFGFTLLSIANNHALDQGRQGREDTIKTLGENGLGWCGDANEPDPESVYYGTVGNKNFAFICLHSAVHKLGLEETINLIKSVRENVDYLIVSIHWGIEYQHTANYAMQVKPAHAFVDAGADLVIGHHPHVVQNFEIYKGKMIFYSLGNFVFDQYWSDDTQQELAIGAVLDHATPDKSLHTKIYLFPMQSEKSQPRIMSEDEKADWLPKFIGYGSYDENTQQEIRNGVIEIP